MKASQRQLSLVAEQAVLTRATGSGQATTASQWLHSGRNLDFCLLAVCSCVLAVLCHQAVQMPTSSASVSLATSTRVVPAQLDFLVKAGLFSTSNQSAEDEEAAE